MQSFPLTSLREDLSFSKDLMLDDNYILLPATCSVTDELIKELREWEFERVLCDGFADISGSKNSGSGNSQTSSNNQAGNAGDFSDDEGPSDKTPKAKIGQSVKQALRSSFNSQLDGSDKSRMAMVQKVYDEYANYIEQIFTHYATHKEIDQEEVSDIVKELCGFIKDNRRYILRVNNTIDCTSRNFLVIHTIRTTVLALAISMQMHLPISKMIELGVACIIHEIGMLRLPPQIYMTDKTLTPGEKIQIYKHPIFGYTIVKDLNFPPNIQLGILEHHERENGTGYPRRMTGDKISSIAKIIAVACSYEAITSTRTYKDEKSNFDAILELLQNVNHHYDENVIKALLYTVSLYPIGSYVFMTNRKPGIVIDSNPDNPKMPVVQMLTEKDKDGSPLEIQTASSDIKILRIMNKREQEDIVKLVYGQVNSAENQQDSNGQEISDLQNPETLEEIPDITVNENSSAIQNKAETKSTEQRVTDKRAEGQKSAKTETSEPDKKADSGNSSESKNNSGNGMETIDISFFN